LNFEPHTLHSNFLPNMIVKLLLLSIISALFLSNYYSTFSFLVSLYSTHFSTSVRVTASSSLGTR